MHLTANATYPLCLALATLLVAVLLGARTLPGARLLALHAAVVAFGTLPVALFLLRGQRLAGQRGARAWLDVGAALVLCAGLSWHLARAVMEGLWGATGEFVRTPKTGSGAGAADAEADSRSRALARRTGRHPAPAVVRNGLAGLPELALAAVFTLVAMWAGFSGRPGVAPFLLVLSAGLAWVGGATLSTPRTGRTARGQAARMA